MVQTTFGQNKVSVKVVGLKFGCKVATGTTVKLVADNNNKFDKDAVMVVTMTGEKVGFVANNKGNKGTLSNKYYKGFKSASDLRNLVDLDTTLVCGNLNVKGSYGLMTVTV
jgi:phage tail sheath gpL-like